MTSVASPSTVPTALQSHVSAFAGSPEIAVTCSSDTAH